MTRILVDQGFPWQIVIHSVDFSLDPHRSARTLGHDAHLHLTLR